MKHNLCKRYHYIGRINPITEVNNIFIDFRSDYAYLGEEGNPHGMVRLNRNAQKKLYELLKKKFEGKK